MRVAPGVAAAVGAPRLLLLAALGLVGEGELRVADAARVQPIVDGLALHNVLERHHVGHPVVYERRLHQGLSPLHCTSQGPNLQKVFVHLGHILSQSRQRTEYGIMERTEYGIMLRNVTED